MGVRCTEARSTHCSRTVTLTATEFSFLIRMVVCERVCMYVASVVKFKASISGSLDLLMLLLEVFEGCFHDYACI